MIIKQTELINGNKEFREKLHITDSKFYKLKKQNEILKSKVSVAEKTLLTLLSNYKSMNEKVTKMERNMHWLRMVLLLKMHRNCRYFKQYYKGLTQRTCPVDIYEKQCGIGGNGYCNLPKIWKNEQKGCSIRKVQIEEYSSI